MIYFYFFIIIFVPFCPFLSVLVSVPLSVHVKQKDYVAPVCGIFLNLFHIKLLLFSADGLTKKQIVVNQLICRLDDASQNEVSCGGDNRSDRIH